MRSLLLFRQFFAHLPGRRRHLSTANLRISVNEESGDPSSSTTESLSSGKCTPFIDATHRYMNAISLLKSETDPSRILSICRSAALSSDHHIGRAALSTAVSTLASSPDHVPSVRSLLSPLLRSDSDLPHAIVLFGLAGLLDDAIAAFRSSPSLRSLNALLFACILSNNHQQAGVFFRDFPVYYRIKPNLLTYNTVIKAFSNSGGSRTFYSYLDEMVRKGIKPNLATFSISITGFYREERFDDVKKVLWLMKKHGRHAGLSIYNVRVQSLCKLGRPGEAKELLREMTLRGMKPNWVTYDHLILGFCSAGDLDEGKRLFKEMKLRALVPQSSCYFNLAHYLCKGGDFEFALEICKESLERNWAPRFTTMKMLVEGLVGMAKVKDAREIVEKMKGKFSRNIDLWKKMEESLPD
ncbi:Pentatricopeptide repeat-containing protein [Apostasia shenzhenica]|uniref:Pentatricopeptide repeat-containing protein n=1 Tax=Apostasia shenzhenica TaxID=1088818 RepID=A0A2I0B7I8_9ASPA|nr:Pentatricopeptide repeat-containing protein [Apostasia shenzhenica]